MEVFSDGKAALKNFDCSHHQKWSPCQNLNYKILLNWSRRQKLILKVQTHKGNKIVINASSTKIWIDKLASTFHNYIQKN